MADVFNTQVNSDDRSKNVVNLARRAEVIFIKKAKLLVDAGYTGESEAIEAANKFSEFIKAGILRESQSLEDRDQNPDNPTEPRNIYWTVSASSVGAVSKVGGTSQLLPNADVEYISATPSTSSPSTASIVLRNPLEKYSFKRNPMYLGQTVFDSDDEVYINLPGLDGKLYRVFTGYITTVSMSSRASDNSFDHTITIECADKLKKLWEVRTNVRPSFISSEAQGSELSIYNNAFSDQLPHEIMAKLMVRAYSDVYSVAGVRSQLTVFRSQDPETGARAEEQFLSRFDKVPPAGSTSSPFMVSDGTVPVQGGVARTPTSIISVTGSAPRDIPKRIYGFRQAPKTSFTLTERAFTGDLAFLTYGGNHPVDDLSFIIEGTSQPVFEKTFAQFSLAHFNSEWKSSYEFVKSIADYLNFEISTTEAGVVRFRAINNLLPADVDKQQTTPFTSDSTKTRVGYEYWLQKKYAISETLTDTDEGIVTVAQVMGQYSYSNLTAAGITNLTVGRAVDTAKAAKLGIRPGPQITRIELLTKEACNAAAMAYLIRVNSKFRSGTVNYTGDARIKPGNPCYIPHRNRVYYIDSVHHEFRPGASYTMTINLRYGRVPVAITASKAAELSKTIGASDPTLNSLITSRYVYPTAISTQRASGLIDPITKLPMVDATQEERYTKHGPLGDKNLVFNGYVWEDLPTCTYEELKSDYILANTALALTEAQQEVRADGQRFKEKMQSSTSRTVLPNKAKDVLAQSGAKAITSSHGASTSW